MTSLAGMSVWHVSIKSFYEILRCLFQIRATPLEGNDIQGNNDRVFYNLVILILSKFSFMEENS